MNNPLDISKVKNSEFEIMAAEITEKQNTERKKGINRKEVLKKIHLSFLYHKLNTQCEWRSIGSETIRKNVLKRIPHQNSKFNKEICVYDIKFKSHIHT